MTRSEYYASLEANKQELFLQHHGVLGQKWGIRRYQNKDGTLTKAGQEKYRPNTIGGHIGRALTNTSISQRLIGVGLNKGYREDKKEIKAKYKELTDGVSKEQKKSIKSDYKKTLAEARTSAAEAIYPWQGTATNTRIQSTNFGKQLAKSMVMGGFGTLTYDQLRGQNYSKGSSVALGLLGEIGSTLTYGGTAIGNYAYGAGKYYRDQKKDK